MRALTACIAVLAIAAASALATFECERVWAGPSADNSLTDCVADPNHLLNLVQDPIRLQYGGAIVLAIIGLVFWLITFPLVTLCRYICGCFGSNRRRPGAFFGGSEWDKVPPHVRMEGYDKRCVRIVFWLPFVMAVCCAAPMGLLLRGADTISDAYDGVFSDVGGLATYMDDKLAAIKKLMQTGNGTYVPPLQESYFTTGEDLVKSLREKLADTKSQYQSYINLGRDIAIAVGCVPLLFFIFNALFALFSIRSILPLINSIFFFLLILIFGVVALILLSVALILRDACGEINAYRDGRKPGIFSWYVAPLCDKQAPFIALKNTIDQTESTSSNSACTELLKICKSDSAAWSAGTPDKIFFCPGLTAASQCTSFKNVSHYVNESTLCTGISNGYGCATSPCTFRQCAKDCTPTSIKNTADATITAMDYAYRAVTAFNDHVRPMLDCNHIMTVALSALASCDTIQEALWLIGSGALLFQIWAGFGIITIWVGQKRWFSDKEAEESRKELANEPFKK